MGMEVYAFNPSTQKAETDGPLGLRGQTSLLVKFYDTLGYTKKLCIEKNLNETHAHA